MSGRKPTQRGSIAKREAEKPLEVMRFRKGDPGFLKPSLEVLLDALL